MTVRIDTTYLGIPLAHPVMASASPPRLLSLVLMSMVMVTSKAIQQ